MVMVMRNLLLAILCMAAMALQAATTPRGGDRLRELVVFPEFNLAVNYGMTFQGTDCVIQDNTPVEVLVKQLRAEIKQHPDNAESLVRLGYLLDQGGETNESRVCFRQAEQLACKRTAANPQNGPAWTVLGKALWGLDQKTEAENAYRRAVLVSSNDWHCWVGLGNFLAGANFSEMFPKNLRQEAWTSMVMPQSAIMDYRPPAEALRAAERSLAEAGQCFARAIALAPQESEVFFQYAGYQSTAGGQNYFFRHVRDNEAIDPGRIFLSSFLSQGTLTNLEKAAELDSKNYELTALWTYLTWMQALVAAKSTDVLTMDMLPDKTRRSIRTAMTRLENLSGSPDKKVAAGAWESHGVLNITFGNKPAAIADFRQAVALDPTREGSWDLLLVMMRGSASFEELETVCRARVAFEDSARNRLLLTKVYTMEKKWIEADKQTRMAGEMETNNIIPPLFLAAIELKQSTQTNYLAEAGDHLQQAGDLLEKMPASAEQTKRWRECTLNAAIYNGLIDQPDTAKAWVKELFEAFPDDETAKAILQALE